MATVAKRDYYEILGVDRNASDDEIKKAFRKLARQHHPDLQSDPQQKKKSEEKSTEISSVPQNSNLMLYVGLTLGVIVGASGIWYVYNHFKNRKKSVDPDSKSEQKSEEVPELSKEELNKLNKIAKANENFKEAI